MTVSDKAIAQAFRERLESMYSPLTVREVMKAVEARARELDAAKGGEPFHSEESLWAAITKPTPPAQASGAVTELVRDMRNELHPHSDAYSYTDYEKGRIDEKRQVIARLTAALTQGGGNGR